MAQLESLEGVTSGRYVVTTLSGARYLLDLDERTAVRYGAPGQEWGSEMFFGELGGGGARPKALGRLEKVTPDGALFHLTLLRDAVVGRQMRLDNPEEWRVTSQVVAIEMLEDAEDFPTGGDKAGEAEPGGA